MTGDALRRGWRRWWARRLVAALERRLQTEACAHDGLSLCPVCRLVTSVGFLPASVHRPTPPSWPAA